MLRRLLAVTAVMAASSLAMGQATFAIDNIADGAGFAELSAAAQAAGYVGADFEVSIPPADGAWLAGEVIGNAFLGAVFIWDIDTDPNTGTTATGYAPTKVNDGDNSGPAGGEKDVYFANMPRNFGGGSGTGQDAAPRFGPGKEPPNKVVETLTATFVDLSFAAAGGDFTQTDGWFGRVVIDISATGFDSSQVAVSLVSPVFSNILASGTIAAGTQGELPSSNRTNWYISAVPEPASLALLVLGGLMAFRRRS